MGEITDALRRAREETPEKPKPAAAGPRGRALPLPEWELEAAIEPAEAAEPAADEPAEPDRIEISAERDAGYEGRVVRVDPVCPASQAYRHFAVRLRTELEQRELRSAGITSALRAEGKTTTACNLALALASLGGGRNIALVDLDLRKPSVAKTLHLEPKVGIEEVLAGNAALREARVPTGPLALDLYLVRRSSNKAHELLSSHGLPDTLRELARRYDFLVLDTPPVLLVPDVPLIAPHIGAVVPVARAGFTRRASFQQMLGLLPAEKVLGAFLNDAPIPEHVRNYGGYYEDEPVAVEDASG